MQTIQLDIVPDIQFPKLPLADDNTDLFKYADEVEKGLNSPILVKSHEEIFKELKKKYV